MIIVMYILSVVADKFLCPCLAEICKKLRVSQDLAISFILPFALPSLLFSYTATELHF